MNIYLVFSVFTHAPTTLLATYLCSVFTCIVLMSIPTQSTSTAKTRLCDVSHDPSEMLCFYEIWLMPNFPIFLANIFSEHGL